MPFSNIAKSEIHTPTLLLGLGAWFLMFDVTNANEAYIYLAVFGDWFWAAVFLFSGATKAAALMNRGKSFNIAVNIWLIILWLTLFVLIVSVKTSSLAAPFSLFAAFLNLLQIIERREK